MKTVFDRIKFGKAPIRIIDGDRGKNYPKQNEYFDSGHCLFLNTSNVRTAGFNFSDCKFITAEKDAVLRKGRLQRNDIVITTRGTLGNVAYYNNDVPYDKIRINSGMVIIRPDLNSISARFLYHYLRSSLFKAQTHSFRSGSAQPQLPIRDLSNIFLMLPPLLTQKRIADILSAYDNLIENNRRRITLLEQSARELYREWFVRFRFPGHEKVKIVDGLPEGWRIRPLSDISAITMGQSPKSEFYNENRDPLCHRKVGQI